MRLTTLTFVLFATCANLLAQQGEGETAVTFSLVGWGEAIESIEYSEGSSLTKVDKVPLFEKSESQQYKGPPEIRFFLPGIEPEVDAQGEKIPAAIAQIPPGAKRVLILLVPEGLNRYRAIVIPDDLDTVPGGKAMLVNLCGATLAVKTNKSDAFKLEDKKSKLVSPKDGSLLLQMELGVRSLDEWNRIESSYLPLPAKYQTFVFFLRSKSDYFANIDGNITKPVQMVVLREPVPEETEEE